MSHSGQQHPKADNGGQRPADPKRSDQKAASEKGSSTDAASAGKRGGGSAVKTAKK